MVTTLNEFRTAIADDIESLEQCTTRLPDKDDVSPAFWLIRDGDVPKREAMFEELREEYPEATPYINGQLRNTARSG